MSYTADLSKLTVTLYESMFGSSKPSEEGGEVQQRTWAEWTWSTGGMIAQEAIKIGVPVAIAYLGGSYAGLKIGDENMTGALVLGGIVGLSPEIAFVRKHTTDVVVKQSTQAVVHTAHKTADIAASITNRTLTAITSK